MRTLTNRIKKCCKAVCFVILFPVTLVLLLALLLCLPPVQQKAVNIATDCLSKATGMDISIGHVGLAFPIDISLRDILVAEPESGDTLVSADKLLLSVNFQSLKQKVIGIDAFSLHGVKADTRDMIPGIAINGSLGKLYVESDSTIFHDGSIATLINDVLLKDADICIFLSDSIAEDSPDDSSGPIPDWKIDVVNVCLENVTVGLHPEDIRAYVGSLNTHAMLSLADGLYDVLELSVTDSRVDAGGDSFSINNLDAVATIDTSSVTVPMLILDASDSVMGISVLTDLSARLDLNSMLISCRGNVRTGDASLDIDGTYAIPTETYSASLDIRGLYLNRLIPMDDVCYMDGSVTADGQGLDFFSANTSAKADLKVDSLLFGPVSLSNTRVNAQLARSVISGSTDFGVSYNDTAMSAGMGGSVRFNVSEWSTSRPNLDISAVFRDGQISNDSLSLDIPDIVLQAGTNRKSTSLKVDMPGISLQADAAGHALALPDRLLKIADVAKEQFDSLDFDISALKEYFPDLALTLNIDSLNPLTANLQEMGIGFHDFNVDVKTSPADGMSLNVELNNFQKDTLSVRQTTVRAVQIGERMNLTADVLFDEQHRLPSVKASVEANVGIHESDAHLTVESDVTDGILSVTDLSGNVVLDLTADLVDAVLSADGTLDLDDLQFGDMFFGDHTIRMGIVPTDTVDYYHTFADIRDFPLSIVMPMLNIPNLDVTGAVDGNVTLDGRYDNFKIRGSVLPKGVRALYHPYEIDISLGEHPILYDDGRVLLNRLPIYGVENTGLIADGTFDVQNMMTDITVSGQGFKPSLFERNDSVPFFGNAEADIVARVSGPADSLIIHSDVRVLPTTQMTYLIDDKNSATARVDGSISLDFTPSGGLLANGRINIPEGEVRYSLPYYPLLPFSISKDSYVEFNGDITKPILNVRATQPAKATVRTESFGSRNVDFIVGLEVTNTLDELGLNFIIEAPDDKEVREELLSATPEERSTIAAQMLATGMYLTVSNAAAMSEGYALSSILQSRLNAFASNKMRGKGVDIDLGIGESSRGMEPSTDYSVKLSRSFFDDRLKVTVGGRLSDSREVNKSSGMASFIDDASLQWQVRKDGKTYLTLFHKNDYDNIVDGELQKDGLGVIYNREWNKEKDGAKGETDHSVSTSFQGNFSHRSNQQIGPDVQATISRDNVLRRDGSLSLTLNGAYYWNYNNKAVNGRSATDSYHIGGDVALSFPRIMLPWKSSTGDRISASTRFGVGYMLENVAGAYMVHKVTGDISYRFRTSPYISHSFTPFSLSLIYTPDMTDEYATRIMQNKSMTRTLLKDEFIPAIGYQFSYNNTSDRARTVTTRFDLNLKESGNLLNGIQTLFGQDFNETDKGFIFRSYSQFFKFNLELRNLFRLTGRTSLATRVSAGSIISFGNSIYAPLSESFYSGGPNSIRAFAARSLGPGNFHSTDKYDPYFLHSGESRLEMNAEYRFPLVWMLEGAVFLDAGNTWNNRDINEGLDEQTIRAMQSLLELWNINRDYSGSFRHNFLNEIALGTGFGVRFVFQTLVVRMDLGIALHAPYDTGRTGYYNITDFWKDGIRLNFAIGYPF